MQLYLFRHGDRNARGSSLLHSDEPDLSSTGRLQADHLRSWVERQTLPTPHLLWVSPRIRAQNTFKPLSDSLKIALTLQADLDERSHRENAALFRERIARALERASLQDGVVFLCSHFDWLEEALTLIPADEELIPNGLPLWSPGSFVGFDVQNEIWKVRQKGQLQTW